MSPDHFWQNWGKTHAFVAEQMFFPTSVYELAYAVEIAEQDNRPLRAVGGGFSLSDAAVPGSVFTERPAVDNVETVAELVPLAQVYPQPVSAWPSVASLAPDAQPPDGNGIMIVLLSNGAQDTDWVYTAPNQWSYRRQTQQGLQLAYGSGRRPVRSDGSDGPGALVMRDYAAGVNKPDWYYNGQGTWTFFNGGSPLRGSINDLWQYLGTLAPAPGNPAAQLEQQLAPSTNPPPRSQPVYLVNTRSLVSSLQQNLPSFLSDSAASDLQAQRRFYFHVEAGITLEELNKLLELQSPRLAVQGSEGSLGATLAGALSTSTHGAEFNWPLLVDRVKAVHLVGPGGQQWWIEGDTPIVNVDRLRAHYPCLERDHIITTSTPENAGALTPQDWLNAVVVSMGCMGVIYSVVLECVPLFGLHQVTSRHGWLEMLSRVGQQMGNLSGEAVRDALRAGTAQGAQASQLLVTFLQDGVANGTGIPRSDDSGTPVNQYGALAINPIRKPGDDFDCWVVNREAVPVALDPQPMAPPAMTDALLNALDVAQRNNYIPQLIAIYGDINGLGSLLADIGTVLGLGSSDLGRNLDRLFKARDTLDIALDTFLTPLTDARYASMAQNLMTAFLDGTMGTRPGQPPPSLVGVAPHMAGSPFPAGGIMGVGMELGLAPADAFGYLQREILDKLPDAPFFGYVSIRLATQTQTFMGMQQFGAPCSVMIETVGFATEVARQFMRDRQNGAQALIARGLAAVPHWGLENGFLDANTLEQLVANLPASAAMQLGVGKFRQIRQAILASAPALAQASDVFSNTFRRRLAL